jgi:hypothetical protein
MLARDLGILSNEEWSRINQMHQKAGGMTWLLYKSMTRKTITVSS